MKPVKEVILTALNNHRGDDYERARMAFRSFTPLDMQEQYGSSGKTRQEIIEGYRSHAMAVDNAINWVNRNIK